MQWRSRRLGRSALEKPDQAENHITWIRPHKKQQQCYQTRQRPGQMWCNNFFTLLFWECSSIKFTTAVNYKINQIHLSIWTNFSTRASQLLQWTVKWIISVQQLSPQPSLTLQDNFHPKSTQCKIIPKDFYRRYVSNIHFNTSKGHKQISYV